jgi:hypothetical protein
VYPQFDFILRFVLPLETTLSDEDAARVARDIRVFAQYHAADSQILVKDPDTEAVIHSVPIHERVRQVQLARPEWNGREFWSPGPDGWVVDSTIPGQEAWPDYDALERHGGVSVEVGPGRATVRWADNVQMWVPDSVRVELQDHFRVKVHCGDRLLHDELFEVNGEFELLWMGGTPVKHIIESTTLQRH